MDITWFIPEKNTIYAHTAQSVSCRYPCDIQMTHFFSSAGHDELSSTANLRTKHTHTPWNTLNVANAQFEHLQQVQRMILSECVYTSSDTYC